MSDSETFASKWDAFQRKAKSDPDWAAVQEEHLIVEGFFDEMMKQYPATGFYTKLYEDCQKAKQGKSETTRTSIRSLKQLIDDAVEAATRANDTLDDLETDKQKAMFVMTRLRKEECSGKMVVVVRMVVL